jgi:hypothetical protein
MTYKLTVDPKPSYLHIVVTGRNSRENVVRYLQETLRECAARNCFNVLIEERLVGPRLGTFEVFQIASVEGSKARGQMRAIAYVDVNAEGDSMQFAGTVAANRAVPVAVFSTVADAEKWLLNEIRGRSEPGAAADTGKPRR